MPGTEAATDVTISGSTSSGVTNDSNHHLHLHSSTLGMALVSSPFDGRGFPGWKRSVVIAISTKKKLCFINGSCVEPTMDGKDYPLWSRCNDMVTSWLLNSLTKEIGDSVIYSRTAKDLWSSLEQRFGQSSGAKLYHLQKEISKTIQGNNSIPGYFTTLKRLWDELDSLNSHLGCTCACNYDGKRKMAKFMEDQRVIQFLMGLNDAYAQARGNILMLSPTPSMDQTYSLLLQDESQREIYMSPQYPTNEASFMVGTQNKFSQENNQAQKGWNPQQKSANTQYKSKPRKSKFNPNVSCSHCSKIGHVRADCYRLIGFPDEFQFTKGGNFQGIIKANATVADQQGDGNSDEHNGGHSNNQTQFSVQVGSTGSGNSEISANAVASASKHMCFDSKPFLTLSPLPVPLHISLPNSFQIFVTHIRQVCIQPDMVLEKVPLMRRGQVFGEVRDGLYLLQPRSLESRFNLVKMLGHLPFSVMKKFNFVHFPSNFNDVCEICAKARQTRLPFSISQIRTTSPFDLIHIDSWGPFNTTTYNGYNYFLTIVDDSSRATWTFLLSTKSNAFPVVKSFLNMVERQFNKKVRRVKSDNAWELGKGNTGI
ncbi:PREDICTED: uncharacterized protein LOC109207052 [Nicotiana attenuata]|uniref:uncharacterized protein LOC109207052 n=1 Tax=Nicotiana attenuata TaxID=49451 RepID=UPI0009055A37|nr:PREDICTED: uncharacterized protein LOC109207052 [Nicotiana attenuata]